MAQPDSLVGLFNMALAWLGGEQLSSVEAPWEESALGRLCRNAWPGVLDLALNAHEWSFSLARAVLAPLAPASPVQLSGSGASGRRYALPADCLRPARLAGGQSFTLEGRELLTLAAPAELIYIRRVEDPAFYPPAFKLALSWGLAAVLATARNNDPQKQAQCFQQYNSSLVEAMARDNNSQKPEAVVSAWGNHRFQGATGAP